IWWVFPAPGPARTKVGFNFFAIYMLLINFLFFITNKYVLTFYVHYEFKYLFYIGRNIKITFTYFFKFIPQIECKFRFILFYHTKEFFINYLLIRYLFTIHWP